MQVPYPVSFLFDPLVLNAIVALTLFYFFSVYTYGKWRKSNVAFPPPVPLFGNTCKTILSLEHQWVTLDRIYRQFPGERVCGYYQMRTPMLMIRDPELIDTIMIKDFGHFTDHGVDIDPSVNLLARGLFFANGQKWRSMRQKLSPGFTSGKIKDAYGQIIECSNQLVREIQKKSDELNAKVGPIEVKETVGNFAIDVIGTCAFGLTLDAITNDDSDFRKYTRKVFGTDGPLQLFKSVMGMLFPKVTRFLGVRVFPLDATNFFYSVFSDVIDYRSKNNVVRNDVAQTLMHARKELVLNDDLKGEDKFCDLDIIANAVLMFFAGAEPVSITLSFCFYELALNKDIQEKLRNEINSAKEKHNGELNNDFLAELHYAEMVLNETLRKYSSTITIMRKATKDYNIPDESLLIEKNQHITIPMYSIHNDPKYYPNPSVFDPERFTAEEKAKRPNGTFFPFGDGLRQCLGKRFAESEMKLVLSEILTKFEILPCEKTERPIIMKFTPGMMKPKNGIWLNFKPILN